jgi:hypothetical protein
MLLRMTFCWSIALASSVAVAEVVEPTGSPRAVAEYPVCTAKIIDKCIEQRAVAKPAAKKATSSKMVRRDKVHRRKG